MIRSGDESVISTLNAFHPYPAYTNEMQDFFSEHVEMKPEEHTVREDTQYCQCTLAQN